MTRIDDLYCDHPKNRKKTQSSYRGIYGTSKCDSYGLSTTLGIIIANSLYQYIVDAQDRIKRDDWKVIEKHADAIRAYATGDSIDFMSPLSKERIEYFEREKAWREAMFWLSENWGSLWW